ncbi:hypothetical protein PPTG_19347 [Phytophthora nicotianae INRA-310]|uniref:Uncharacterized protein n=1 Tax=Phytophthora nicotianae (strain INRA-310) TaxID=761204 RepID=W2PEL0_PHYN3|nr:hypothetical protein PPTG_19347 [Phytophthora nicotianae INRA-310]ETM98648.1 hypothetical protein PPTG_19347 [Phytophthora nicotianae INRA-310]
MHQQPPSSQTSQHSQYSQHSQETPTARPALQKPAPLGLSGDTSSSSQPKTLASDLAAEVAASLPPTDAATSRGGSTQHGFGNAAPSADSVFSSDIDRSASSHFGGGAQASADAVFGGYSRSDNNVACPFGQQSSAPSASYGGTQSYSQYACNPKWAEIATTEINCIK